MKPTPHVHLVKPTDDFVNERTVHPQRERDKHPSKPTHSSSPCSISGVSSRQFWRRIPTPPSTRGSIPRVRIQRRFPRSISAHPTQSRRHSRRVQRLRPVPPLPSSESSRRRPRRAPPVRRRPMMRSPRHHHHLRLRPVFRRPRARTSAADVRTARPKPTAVMSSLMSRREHHGSPDRD